MYNQLKLDNQLCFRLYTAARLVMRAYWPYFEPLGITYPQYLVLMVLWESDQQPVNDIAKRLLLATNTITPLLQRMEQQGLVCRHHSPSDTRKRIVCLTDIGKALEQQAQDIPNCLNEQISKMGFTMEDIAQMIPLLDKMIPCLQQLCNPNRTNQGE